MTALGRFFTMPCCGCAMTAVCGCAMAAVGSSFVLGTLFQHSVSIDRGFAKNPLSHKVRPMVATMTTISAVTAKIRGTSFDFGFASAPSSAGAGAAGAAVAISYLSVWVPIDTSRLISTKKGYSRQHVKPLSNPASVTGCLIRGRAHCCGCC